LIKTQLVTTMKCNAQGGSFLRLKIINSKNNVESNTL